MPHKDIRNKLEGKERKLVIKQLLKQSYDHRQAIRTKEDPICKLCVPVNVGSSAPVFSFLVVTCINLRWQPSQNSIHGVVKKLKCVVSLSGLEVQHQGTNGVGSFWGQGWGNPCYDSVLASGGWLAILGVPCLVEAPPGVDLPLQKVCSLRACLCLHCPWLIKTIAILF